MQIFGELIRRFGRRLFSPGFSELRWAAIPRGPGRHHRQVAELLLGVLPKLICADLPTCCALSSHILLGPRHQFARNPRLRCTGVSRGSTDGAAGTGGAALIVVEGRHTRTPAMVRPASDASDRSKLTSERAQRSAGMCSGLPIGSRRHSAASSPAESRCRTSPLNSEIKARSLRRCSGFPVSTAAINSSSKSA